MKKYQIYIQKTEERVFLEPFYGPGQYYDPKEDAERVYEFFRTLPGETRVALKRRIFRDVEVQDLDSLLGEETLPETPENSENN